MYRGDRRVLSDHPCACPVSGARYYCVACGTNPLCHCQLHWIFATDEGLCVSCLARHIQQLNPIEQGLQWRRYLDGVSGQLRQRATRSIYASQTTAYEVESTGTGGPQFLITTIVDEREGITIKVSRPRGEQNAPTHIQQSEATIIEWGPTYGERDRTIPGPGPCPGCQLPPGHMCSCPF